MSVLDIAMALVDSAAAVLPAPTPTRSQLEACRIISHRGEHCARDGVPENTLAAFRRATEAGVWGIECDIRWTADLTPVICHDPTTARVFGTDRAIAATSFKELRKTLPLIPSLGEVIAEFGENTHLMLELKAEPWRDVTRQHAILRDALKALQPGRDYHLLALDTDLFDHVDFAPPASFLPVAELNVEAMSRFALATGCAGIGGHYLLLGKRLQAQHAAVGQRLGVGFPTSANCLRRQLHRGIEWIFSNHAAELERCRQRMLAG